MKRRSVGVKETKSETLIVRLQPSVKNRLVCLSDETGFTMSALVEYAIERLDVSELVRS